jgi:phage FluMu protein Com
MLEIICLSCGKIMDETGVQNALTFYRCAACKIVIALINKFTDNQNTTK